MPQPTTQNKEMDLKNLSIIQLSAIYNAVVMAESKGHHSDPNNQHQINQLLIGIIREIDANQYPGEPTTKDLLEGNNPYSEESGFNLF